MIPSRTALASVLVTLSLASAAGAQPRRPPSGPQAAGAEATAIQRNTATHETNFGVIPPERELPRGEVGSTGQVISHGPQGELRGAGAPAPDAIDLSQPIGPGDVARIVRTQDARFRACYDQARARRPALQGRVNMRFVVQRDGSLAQVDVTGLPEAPEVSTCIRAHLTGLRLPRPEAGTLAFNTGMNFSPPPAAPGRRVRGRPTAARH